MCDYFKLEVEKDNIMWECAYIEKLIREEKKLATDELMKNNIDCAMEHQRNVVVYTANLKEMEGKLNDLQRKST